MKPTIAAIVLTKNEEMMIANCLDTIKWCDEVWVVDHHSDDATTQIAEKMGAHVVHSTRDSFAERRNEALQQIHTDWIFYVDADERVTPQLAREICVQIETTQANALAMHRQNVMYGKVFNFGGWSEVMERVFRRETLSGWKGALHESPHYVGESTLLHTSLLHLTHRNTIDGLKKTTSWTPVEARLLYEAHTAPVTIMTLIRKGVMEVLRRGFLKQGYKDGKEGMIEAIVQGINRILVYIQVWELQQSPSLKEKYGSLERDIAEQWKNQKV